MPYTLPGDSRVDLQQHGERSRREQLARRGSEHRAPAERDDDRLAPVEHLRCGLLLDRTEAAFPRGGEEVGDRGARAPLDLVVEVEEGPVEAARDL